MNEHHKDAFIGISVQNYSASDPMYCTAYEPWKRNSAPEAPYYYVNRNKMLTTNPERHPRGRFQYGTLPYEQHRNKGYGRSHGRSDGI